MSKENPFKYINNVLRNIKRATPLLITFYKSHSKRDLSLALLKGGGFNVILFEGIYTRGILEEKKLISFINQCEYLDTLTEESNDPTGDKSVKKTLQNFDLILEGWVKLHDMTLKLVIELLEPYSSDLRVLNGDSLNEYCTNLLNYGKNFKPEKIEHFVSIVKTHIKKDLNRAY